MDQKTVNKLEDKLTDAMADVVLSMSLNRLPLLPSRHTMHLMAKAATAVYESAVENTRLAHESHRPPKSDGSNL